MGEQDELDAIGVFGEWIWGDDLETIVFAQAFGHNKTLIFRFSLDGAHSDEAQAQPSSLVARIVNCYHNRVAYGTHDSFLDRSSMRKAIWSTVALVWDACTKHPEINRPDVIIDVDILDREGLPHISWGLCHEGLFNDYLGLLLPPSQLSLRRKPATIDFNSLIRQNQIGGRGCTTLVNLTSDPGSQYVFKGVDFRTFLHTYEGEHVREEVKTFYRSLKLISDMSPHPNIMAEPLALVTLQRPDDEAQLVCGTLYPFTRNGTVASQIERANRSGERISLLQKAKWCHQMVSAIAHTHLVARTYHMDIKPGNFLVDESFSLVLIDWEQSDAPVSTAAPEIDGTWDVKQVPGSPHADLLYTEYKGPARRNMPITTPGDNGWNVWNVFPIWSKECPKAAELAEVFSLARSMWMLLRQPDMETLEDIMSTTIVSDDWSSCEDIPIPWKRIIERCCSRNPNERCGLRELLAFWNEEQHSMESDYQ